jgi:hypothetical protein
MPRPLYESPTDLANELDVAGVLAARWKVSPCKLPISYGVDFGLFRDGAPVAWAEIKCRTNARDRYATYCIALGKAQAGLMLSRATGRPFAIVVRWTDRLGYLIVKSIEDIRWGGRRDRGDSADLEPMVHWPTESFINL